jgi:phage terminase large subunit-like protein
VPDTTEEPPAVVSQPTGIEAGAKLIIETRDGMRVERFMNTVRRVTVENGQIVVVMKDGKIARHPMANVTRMAIEP